MFRFSNFPRQPTYACVLPDMSHKFKDSSVRGGDDGQSDQASWTRQVRGQWDQATRVPTASSEVMTNTEAKAAPATVPALRLRDIPAPRFSDGGPTLSTLRPDIHKSDLWEALGTSGWSNIDGESAEGTYIVVPSSPIAAHATRGEAEGTRSSTAEGFQSGGVERSGASLTHGSAASESATDASGLASPAGLRSTGPGYGSASSRYAACHPLEA